MITPFRHTPLLPGTLQNLFYPPREYTYFARAAQLPFAPGATPMKAAWAADAAMLTYARYGARYMTEAELADNFGRGGLAYEKIGDWDAPGTQGVFARGENFAILSFRGTDRDDPANLVTDADIALVLEPDYRPAHRAAFSVLGYLALVSHLYSLPCLVHRGFQLALNQVWGQVQTQITNYRLANPIGEICFTGHSLGAALAVLAFSRYSDPGMSLYTFGCPRVGDGAFRERVLSNPGRGVHRYVNFNDAVTHVPLENVLYQHAPPPCYRFLENGDLDTNDDGSFKGDIQALETAVLGLPALLNNKSLDDIEAPPSLVDHSPARYCFRLWDCV